MISQKLILPTTVQTEIDEVALLYAPVLLLILTHFFITTFSSRGNLLALSRGSENSRKLLTLKEIYS